MSETVLVTGGTGFVAGWCIVELLQRGYRVRTTVRSPAKESAVRLAIAAAHEFDDKLSFAIADLTSDAGWDAAMAGIDYVLHVASPLGTNAPRQANALIEPARDGTLRVLRAAVKAGVKRVVMTSAATAARPPHRSNGTSDETVWTDPADRAFDAYRLSKILAERAAWDFMASHGGTTELTTILPGAVFGPVLSKDNLGSVQIIDRMLQGRPPGLPRLGFWIVDVRDLADLHIRAMTAPQAAGQRFLAAGDFMWMQEVAQTLRDKLGEKAARVPRRRMPDLVFKMMALVVPQLRMFTPELGRKLNLSTTKARRVLGFAPRSAQATIVACAESLLAS